MLTWLQTLSLALELDVSIALSGEAVGGHSLKYQTTNKAATNSFSSHDWELRGRRVGAGGPKPASTGAHFSSDAPAIASRCDFESSQARNT